MREKRATPARSIRDRVDACTLYYAGPEVVKGSFASLIVALKTRVRVLALSELRAQLAS